VQTEKIVRLVRNERNQAKRIPRDLEFPGNEDLVCKKWNRLIADSILRPIFLSSCPRGLLLRSNFRTSMTSSRSRS